MRYSLEEVGRFYAFFIGVKSLVEALQWDYGNDSRDIHTVQQAAPEKFETSCHDESANSNTASCVATRACPSMIHCHRRTTW